MTASIDARKAYAAARWAALGDRVRSITPESLARVLIGTATLGLVGWLAVASWPALAPFVAGLVLAYAVLPIANRLDGFMPRVAAALVAELVALGILAGVGLLVVPPLIRSLVVVAGLLPTADQINSGVDRLQSVLGGLQDPVRGIVLSVSTQVAENLRTALDGFVSGVADFATQQILGIAGTLSFVLGLLVIPAWILTMVSDDRAIRRRAIAVVSPGMRGDVMALARIVDRAVATFLRIRVLLAIVAGSLTWVGLEAANQLGLANFQYAAAGATLLGILQLIPELGFFLGFVPIALVALLQGPGVGLVALGVYWAATKLASMLVETKASRGVLDVHPALLIPGIVVLSQFGIGWTLMAAPLIAIGRDLIRYLNGRLGDPPSPAGVLPGDRPARRLGAAAAALRIPSAYRTVAARPVRAPARASAPVRANAPASAGLAASSL
ncbi:MAG TPA: AI-2E family transporter, partial [Candidatus Limnocylindrales bacterium]